MEQDPTNCPTQDDSLSSQQWFEVGARPEGVDDDIWTGSPTDDEDFDPNMFNTPLRGTDEPREYNWMEIGVRARNGSDDTWTGEAGWGSE